MKTRNISIIAGIGYLIIFVSGIFANFFVVESLFSTTELENLFNVISQNESIFRLGTLSFVFMVVADVILSWALYYIFKETNESLSKLSAWLRLVNCTIFGVALFNLLNVNDLIVMSGMIPTNELNIELFQLYKGFNNIWFIGLIFFAIHLYILGYLAYKKENVPNIIAILLFLAAVGYTVDSIASIAYKDYYLYKDIFSNIVIIPGVLGELSFTFWLLIKGK